jgi:hypothetical protein
MYYYIEKTVESHVMIRIAKYIVERMPALVKVASNIEHTV